MFCWHSVLFILLSLSIDRGVSTYYSALYYSVLYQFSSISMKNGDKWRSELDLISVISQKSSCILPRSDEQAYNVYRHNIHCDSVILLSFKIVLFNEFMILLSFKIVLFNHELMEWLWLSS